MCDLNEMAKEVHLANRHWWHHPATGERLNRNVDEMLMLMVSEISEAMEGERKSLMDDHLPHRPMAEVEMADLVIRALDFAGGFDVPMVDIRPIKHVGIDATNRAARLMEMTRACSQSTANLLRGGHELTALIRMAEKYCLDFGYDLWGAVAEKRAYNATRVDHKAEARLAANGKKW